MLETQVEISDALASKGYRKAMSTKAFVQISAYYGQQLAIVWVIIAIADALADAEYLISYHLLVFIAIWIVASAMRYRSWTKEVEAMKGWSFVAKLDERGVVTNFTSSDEQRYDWSFYKNYVEYETYLQIEDENGGFSFLPKTPELFEAIEFTKQKIPAK